MNRRISVTIAFFCFMTAANALASSRLLRVKVTIKGACAASKNIWITFNGDEASSQQLGDREKDGAWWIDWVDEREKGEPFPRGILTASLRADGMRLNCVKATDGVLKGDRRLAVFVFHCDQQSVSDFDIKTVMAPSQKPLAITYRRHFDQRSGASLDCAPDETSSASIHGRIIIEKVRFGDENVLLQLGFEKAPPKRPGLLLFSVGPHTIWLFTRDDPPQVNPEFKDYANQGGGGITLPKNGVVTKLREGRALATGDFSDSATAYDYKQFETLKSVEVTVKK